MRPVRTSLSQDGDTVAATIERSTRTAFSFELSPTIGIEAGLCPDTSTLGWGIDNVAYSVTPAGPDFSVATQVPLPSSHTKITADMGWQPHTVRGAMAAALKKNLGLEVTSEKVEDRARVEPLAA